MIEFMVDGVPCHYVQTAQDMAQMTAWTGQHRAEVLGLDTETNALDPWAPGFRVRLIQISDGYTAAWLCSPSAAASALVREHRRFVAHYSEAEIRFLGRDPAMADSVRMTDSEPHVMDTQPVLAHYDPRTVITEAKKDGLDPRLPHPKGLKETYEREFSPVLGQLRNQLYARFKELAPKGLRTSTASRTWGFGNIPAEDMTYLAYGAMDAIAVKRLWDKMMASARVQRTVGLVLDDVLLQWDIDRMTFRGMPNDPPYVRWLNDVLGTVVADNAAYLAQWGIKPSAMGDAVGRAFESLGVAPVKVTKAGKPSWDKEAMGTLLESTTDPRVVDLASTMKRSRQAGKFRSTYLAPMMASLYRDGAVHCSFRAVGTTTHRNSASNPPLQQLPKKDTRIRAAVGGRPGWVVVSCDLAQGEPRVMAALSGDPAYVAAVNSGDVNNSTTAAAFGDAFIPAEGKLAGTASYLMRQGGKAGFLADCYGGGDSRVSKTLGLPIEQGAAIRKRWHETYHVMFEEARQLNTQEYIILPNGRQVTLWDRKFVGPDGQVLTRSKPSRKALNYRTQAWQRDILVQAWLRRLRDTWQHFLLFLLHDEIVLFVPEWLAEQACADLQRAMTVDLGNGVIMTCEATIDGRTWTKQPSDFDLRELASVDTDDEVLS